MTTKTTTIKPAFISSFTRHTAQVAVLLSLLTGAMHSQALPSDANQPIRLLADRATYKESTGTMTYQGNVTITQGTLKLTASDITVKLSDNRSIDSAVATGSPATMQQVVTQEKGLAKGPVKLIIMP